MKYCNCKEEFDGELKAAGDKLVVVDFTASWCGPCKAIAPVFEKMQQEITDVVFFKVDVDEAEDVVGECNISSMPTFVFFKNGKEIDRFSGASADKLKEYVAKHK